MGDRFEFWHVGSQRRRNHPRQIFCQSVHGLGVLTPRNFTISIWLAGRSYNSVSTAVPYYTVIPRGPTRRCFTPDRLWCFIQSWTSSTINSGRSVVNCRQNLSCLPSSPGGAVNNRLTALAVCIAVTDGRCTVAIVQSLVQIYRDILIYLKQHVYTV